MFMPDPHRAGERVCVSGDYGRWQPEGKLEFLGRRDNQIKVRGFRIEIGEIEEALSRVPGIGDGAVVVAEGAEGSKHLVACYSGERPLDVDVLRERLGQALPEYMVPSAFHWQESLPLTPNGKIDRRTLTALAAQLAARCAVGQDGTEQGYQAPSTPSEQRVAAAWATVLGIAADQIDRRDHFVDRGGTSLSAVKLAIALDRAVSHRDVSQHPILADLAELVERVSELRSA
jgi:hypothetical protein